ncbi:hypothetical protein C8R47DRAFT_968588 [Mycena vitilis]|nr:hypothetical protein C8R47DRAFT_968588 [Mycena vitilis]
MGPSEGRRSLEREHAFMQKQLETFSYPCITLPPEVLSQIFILCLRPPRARPNVTEAPLLLCNVCKIWRDTAITTPELWSSLQVNLNSSLFGSNFIDLLDLWLSRSGSQPLSLGVCYNEFTMAQRRQPLHQLNQLLMRHSEQWVDLELRLAGASEFLQFKGHFPALRTLVVDHPVEPSQFRVTSFLDAPRLANAQLGFACGLRPILLPWAQLTVLRCESLSVMDCFSLLHETTRIIEFTVYLDWDGPKVPGSALLLLPTLRSLHLLREGCHMDLLDHLTLPALEALSISFDPIEIPRFLLFLTRSSCSLQRIIIDAWEFRQEHLVQCFAAMSGVQELKLWRPCCLTDDFLGRLEVHPLLLPDLEVLELHHVLRAQFKMRALVKMLFARRSGPVRLQKFWAELCMGSMDTDRKPLASVPGIRDLKASGMDLHIEYSERSSELTPQLH